MPLFSFRKKKEKKQQQLRKTKSTGNIAEEKVEPTTEQVAKEAPEIRVSGSTSTSDYSSSSDESDSDNESVSSLPAQRTRPQHMTLPRASIAKSNSSPCTPQEQQRSSYFSSGDLELLLSQETQARIDAQEKAAAAAVETPPPRKTTLKFELPVTPSRSRSPAYSAYSRPRQRWSLPDEKLLDEPKKSKKKSKRKSRWNRIMRSDDEGDSDEESARKMQVGDKVYLLHRPLPIFGYVRYMGTMDTEPGDDWVGVELESRVGKNDGSVNGRRYFQTDPHRGIFVRQSELGFA
ncbi:hypothetical protein BJV82DRAFT_573546 [Fennellomyces sp. T-0311]|nr:hypothetical protein BJV82DRAFT_573546 [Fennellomyces sp. T-0311]